ncbi:MAG: phosphoglucosamine mutase [Bacteroidia bacterium]|nr:phosphoglucosamine mutase [Bacteroidia bacterium]MDW8347998.1 phosphoglucosamine mutase [Bacteroidia bacterium]
MALITSISGIRGTIGGIPGQNLTPTDIVKFTAAYAKWCQEQHKKQDCTVVVGRDGRSSGVIVEGLVINTLMAMGVQVLHLGLSTTPTVEVAVIMEKADGGIIITASHNPKEWNALKLLNNKGEFISAQEGEKVIQYAQQSTSFASIDQIGTVKTLPNYINKHIERILSLPLVKEDLIRKRNFVIVVDGINSTGGIAVPALLKALGVAHIIELNCEPNGHFAHNPEPLPEHLTQISKSVVQHKADLGIVVDPDVDRLALICEDGSMFGEEYTLVAVADYVLSKKVGNTVSNLSSSRALRDITIQKGGQYYSAPVGEVNVVAEMKRTQAVIGGEGNGGIIYPDLHYGRDALVGIALFLSYVAEKKQHLSEIKAYLPQYYMYKGKINLTSNLHLESILDTLQNIYPEAQFNTSDGIKIDFPDSWIHLRKSNTEPIMRIYTEAKNYQQAQQLAQNVINLLQDTQTLQK